MAVVTANDHGPAANVAMWICLVAMVLVAAAKIFTKWEMTKRVQMDDCYMVLAVLLAVGQSVATSAQVQYGLGQNQDTLTEAQVDSFYLAQYVAQLLYLVTIFTAKLIGLHFFISLTATHRKRAMVKGVNFFVMVWMGIGILVVSFQCHVPQPWLNGQTGCINQPAFWTINAIVDITTQLMAGLFPVLLLQGLQVAKSRKRIAMFSFTPNLLTIILAILRLVYLFASPPFSPNYTWTSFNLALATSLHALLSVTIAGIPFSKAIFDSLILAPHIITDETRGAVVTAQDRSTFPTFTKSSLLSASTAPRGRLSDNVVAVRNTVTINASRDEQELHDYDTRDGSQEQIFAKEGSRTHHVCGDAQCLCRTPHHSLDVVPGR
ncbi:hypothetical protein MMC13_002697 [Lambiella insularis]|nr:hypothetical protein [Lambiella insularis]